MMAFAQPCAVSERVLDFGQCHLRDTRYHQPRNVYHLPKTRQKKKKKKKKKRDRKKRKRETERKEKERQKEKKKRDRKKIKSDAGCRTHRLLVFFGKGFEHFSLYFLMLYPSRARWDAFSDTPLLCGASRGISTTDIFGWGL
jgi:hypothetical protein